MTRVPLLFRWALRLVPRRWRASVERDLREEAIRSGGRGVPALMWLVMQAIGISLRLASRALADRWQERARWSRSADGVVFDARLSARAIVRQPGSIATIVVTLALGMAATTTVFAVFNHVLFRPIPGVGDPDGLVTVYFQPADRHPHFRSAPRAALAALQQVSAFESLAAATDAELAALPTPGADADVVRVAFVTDGYLDALRVRSRAGRLLVTDDHTARRQVALVSESWWRSELSGDPSALGRTITINREPVTIVGILDGYRGWGAVRIGTVDVWMPMNAPLAERAAVSTDYLFTLVGRLAPGITASVAEQQLRGPFEPFAADARTVMTFGSMSDAPAVPTVYPGLYEIGQDSTREHIAALFPFAFGAGGLLLLLACANTSNLLLARTMKRRRDLAVRSAIGASRWRLARGLLIEAAMVVGLAAGVGLALSRVFAGLVQGEQLFAAGPALDAVGLDWRVFAFVGAIGAATVVLFGLLPALAASRPGLPGGVGSSGRATRGSRRLRAALVCVQLALAVTLLSGAGVLVKTLQNLRAIDLGMDTGNVVSFAISAGRLGYDRDEQAALGREILARLRSAPGVASAAVASPSPLAGGTYPASLKVQPTEQSPEHHVASIVAGTGYFETLGIPLLAGHAFSEADANPSSSTEGVGIINQSLARQLFGEGPAVGRQIYLSRAARGWELQRTIEVIGVAGDTRFGADLRESGRPAFYEPGAGRSAVYFVRSALPPLEAASVVRATLREVDPTLPLAEIGPLSATVDRLIPEERLLALLLGGIALIAMLLGLSGVHAVIAHTVAERTREFGIRIALGATRATVSRGVLRGVVALALVGLLSGLATFAGASQWLEARVYGVSALDPATLASVSVLLVAAALAGAWLPARRATRVDPVVALRAE